MPCRRGARAHVGPGCGARDVLASARGGARPEGFLGLRAAASPELEPGAL